MNKKYRVLGVISTLVKIIGIIVMAVGLGLGVFAIYDALRNEQSLALGLSSGGPTLVTGFIAGLLLISFGELLEALIDIARYARRIEANTRLSAKIIQQQAADSQRRYAPGTYAFNDEEEYLLPE